MSVCKAAAPEHEPDTGRLEGEKRQDGDLKWYAVYCHPHKERFVSEELAGRKLEVFYPCLRVKPVNPRCSKIRPYFPGYIFVRADLAQLGESYFRWLPHANGLVCFGGAPADVPDALIGGLRRHLQHTRQQAQSHEYRRGERVGLCSELFRGYEAVFEAHLPGSERVRVLLKMLDERCMRLELHRSQVVRV